MGTTRHIDHRLSTGQQSGCDAWSTQGRLLTPLSTSTMAQSNLPPGWHAKWDGAAGRHVFEHTESGRVQMQPPSYSQGMNGPGPGPGGDPNRAFSPSNAPQAPASPPQQQQQ